MSLTSLSPILSVIKRNTLLKTKQNTVTKETLTGQAVGRFGILEGIWKKFHNNNVNNWFRFKFNRTTETCSTFANNRESSMSSAQMKVLCRHLRTFKLSFSSTWRPVRLAFNHGRIVKRTIRTVIQVFGFWPLLSGPCSLTLPNLVWVTARTEVKGEKPLGNNWY